METPVQKRPGGRSAAIAERVFTAALELLATSGWSEFSIDAVAAESGVHRTTIYRRWRSRDSLAAAAISNYAQTLVPLPDSGSLQDDLCAIAREIQAAMSSPLAATLIRLGLDAGADQPELARLRKEFFDQRFRQVTSVIDRAVSRGEAPQGTNGKEVGRTISAPLLTRLLVTGEPLSTASAELAARIALAGIEAGVFIHT